MKWSPRQRPRTPLGADLEIQGQPREVALTRRIAALLLDYPDDRLLVQLPDLALAVGALPDPARRHLTDLLEHLAGTSPQRAAADYVAAFDMRRRCCLYLTYYAYGDTRKRGMALLAFKNAYRRAGMVLADSELPDHLCVVLEFAATVDPDAGTKLLLDHRAGLEVLRLSLVDSRSPYVGALAAVCCTLPPLAGEERDAVAALAAQGPPDEEVGLEPFAPPEYMGASR